MDFVFDRAKLPLPGVCLLLLLNYGSHLSRDSTQLSTSNAMFFPPSIIPVSQIQIFSTHAKPPGSKPFPGIHVSMCALPKGPTTAPLSRSILISRMRRAVLSPPLFCHPLPAARAPQTASYVAVQVERVSSFSKGKSFVYFIASYESVFRMRAKDKIKIKILYDLLYVGGASRAPLTISWYLFTVKLLPDPLFMTRLWIEMPRLADERVSRGVF